MAWKDVLRPASFRGVAFKVENSARAGGRRGVNFEYPKRNTPSDEDLGRHAFRWAVDGYVIGLDYLEAADDLEAALNEPGHGLLIHPTMGEMVVRCERYTRSESKDRGGFAGFTMSFVEKGSAAADLVSEPTQAQLVNQAEDAARTLAARANAKVIGI